MARYYKKRIVRVNRDKYSVEQQAGTLSVPVGNQAYATVVPDSSIQGMRKVKHLTVTMGDNTTGALCFYWALVYVPQGTNPSALNLTGGVGMYEPNQFVMNCGVADLTAGPARIHSPVSRNLNSGDRIVLIVANTSTETDAAFHYVVRYAITLQ